MSFFKTVYDYGSWAVGGINKAGKAIWGSEEQQSSKAFVDKNGTGNTYINCKSTGNKTAFETEGSKNNRYDGCEADNTSSNNENKWCSIQ